MAALDLRTSWEARFHRPLPREFFDRPTARVARDLLGCYLVRASSSERSVPLAAVRLVETEAYVGNDPASHAFRGETRRNRSMFLGPGHLYVYRIHQVHCANATTRPGEAVLLRAGEPITPLPSSPRGPGLLCRALGIDGRLDGSDLLEGEVRVLPRDAAPRGVSVTPRVGLRLAARTPLRFLDAGSEWVSRGRPRAPRARSP